MNPHCGGRYLFTSEHGITCGVVTTVLQTANHHRVVLQFKPDLRHKPAGVTVVFTAQKSDEIRAGRYDVTFSADGFVRGGDSHRRTDFVRNSAGRCDRNCW